jgi:hypothetical protein
LSLDIRADVRGGLRKRGRGGPLGPDEPNGPNHGGFRRGTVDPRKWDAYLFDPDHPQDEGKDDGPKVERTIHD